MMSLRWRSALALGLLLGCTRSRTQMVLCLGTDISQPASPASRSMALSARIEQVCGLDSFDSSDQTHRLDSVQVEIRTPDGQVARSFNIRIALPEDPARNQLVLPRDLVVIEPRGGDSSRPVLVRVIGQVAVTASAERSEVVRDTVASFRPGETTRISVFLPSLCVGITCPRGRTCGEGGRCISNSTLQPVVIPAQPPDPGPTATDAGTDVDSGSVDVTDSATAREDLGAGTSPGQHRDAALYGDVTDTNLGAHDPFSGCRPLIGDGTDVGGRCAGLAGAWTAREINVGYYPFRATRGAARRSTASGAPVNIPVGALVALSSVATNYSADCDLSVCTRATGSCATRSPPLARGVFDPSTSTWFFWGYSMSDVAPAPLGWISAADHSMEFTGNTATTRVCAYGPGEGEGGGVDFEASAARCGPQTAGCTRSCDGQNACSEGSDDCGRALCGGRASYPPPAEQNRVVAGLVYLRWAQQSTPKTWLDAETRVRVLFRNHDARGRNWYFVELLSGTLFAPVGLRGWVLDSDLR